QKEHRFSAMLAAEGVEGPDPNEHAPEEHAHAEDHRHAGHGHDEATLVHLDDHGHGAAHDHVTHDHGGAHDHGSPSAPPPAPAEAHGHHDAHAHEPHESPWVITVALSILAMLGIFGGHFWLTHPLGVFDAHPWFEKLVSPVSLYGEEVASWCAPEPSGAA